MTVRYFILFVLLCGKVAASRDITSDLEIRLVPQVETIRQYDPLFIAVHVKNIGEMPLEITKPLRSGAGTITIARRYGSFPWHNVNIRGAGTDCAVRIRPFVLSPGESIVRHEVLFARSHRVDDIDELVFSRSGRLELMTRVSTGNGHGYSKPVKLRVRPISNEQRDIVTSFLPLIPYIDSASSGLIETWPLALIEAEDKLDDSTFKQMISWARILHQIRKGKPAQKAAAENEIHAYWKNADPVSQEVIALRLSDCYRHMKDYEKGIKMTRILKQRTETGLWLSRYFSSRLKDAN